MKDLNNIIYINTSETRIDLEKEIFENDEFMLYHKSFDSDKYVSYQGFYSPMNLLIYQKSGSSLIKINSTQYELKASEMIIVPAGAIFCQESPDKSNNYGFFHNIEHFPIVEPVVLSLSKEEAYIFCHYMDLIWAVVKKNGYVREIVHPLIVSLAQWVHQIPHEEKEYYSDKVIVKFMDLVNRHSHTERSLEFYASKLFMTPHYLSAYIRKLSGRRFTDWINYSVVQKINVLLLFTEKSLNEIAEEMNFANGAELSRYYKRHTGTTPYKFRKNT